MEERKDILNTDSSKKLDTNQKVDIDSLNSRLEKLEIKANDIESDLKKSKFDLVTLLGIFVGLITYLGLEIQVFKTIPDPLMIIGVSMFFIASLLLFILCINTLIKKSETLTWNDFKNPLFIILLFLFTLSIVFILYGYIGFNVSQGSNKNAFLQTYGY